MYASRFSTFSLYKCKKEEEMAKIEGDSSSHKDIYAMAHKPNKFRLFYKIKKAQSYIISNCIHFVVSSLCPMGIWLSLPSFF